MKNKFNPKIKPREWRFQPNKWLKTFIYKFNEMSFAKHILFFYTTITVVGSLLLFFPISHAHHAGTLLDPAASSLGYIDALFISASAFSDTGLSPVNVAYTFNMFGQAVIAILIFLGGIGWFALKVYIFNIVFGRQMTYLQRQTLSAERGDVKAGVTKELIKVAVTTLLIITVLATVALTLIFYYVEPTPDFDASGIPILDGSLGPDATLVNDPHGDVWMSLRMGAFHSISAINNAGFDLIGNNSLAPYYHNFSIQIVFMFLFIIGGIGYPVIYDINMWIRSKYRGERFQFSLFTKLSTATYVIISMVGLATVFSIELTAQDSFWTNTTGNYGSDGDKVMALFFNTMSTRNAGFSTIWMHELSRATLIVFSIMMFIGSAPSSTAGGIRTTTLAVVVLGVWARLRGRSNVYAFGKRIPTDTVNKSYIVFTVSITLVFIAILVGISSFDTNGGEIPSTAKLLQEYRANDHFFPKAQGQKSYYDFTEMIFECASAFGTTGLTAGITSMLSIPTMLFLIFLMFVGQLGVSSSIFVWGKRKNNEKHYRLVKEDITVG